MGTTYLSLDEVLEFIAEQPADRPVDMTEPDTYSGPKCGCLLVHIAQEWNLADDGENLSCGFWQVNNSEGRSLEIPCSVSSLFSNEGKWNAMAYVGTYGELQKRLLPKEKIRTF